VPTAPGTFSFTLTVEDTLKGIASKSVTVKINKDLVLATSSLKEGKVGKSYSMTLKATGGNSPYTWNLTAESDDFPTWVDQDKFKQKGIITARKE